MDILEFKEYLKKEGASGLALDIDETLAASDDHWWTHMQEHHPITDMTREEIAAKYKFAEDVPAWRSGEALSRIKSLIYSEDFHDNLPLIHGADIAVKKVNEIIPIKAYITVRPTALYDVTKRWLARHGFPSAELIMRSEEIDLNNEAGNKSRWKANVLASLYPEIVGIVDDNPGLAEQLEEIRYAGKVFLYGTAGKRIEDHACVLSCPSWNDVLNKLHKL